MSRFPDSSALALFRWCRLRTPAYPSTTNRSVMGMTALALELAQDPERQGYLTTVQTSADALLTVLNDILDFSKVEAGKMELEVTDFDLDQSFHHVLQVLAIRAKEKGLRIVVRKDEDVPRFLAGDPHRLQQILFNLGGNALKFTESGETRIEARLQSDSAESVTLEFVVADTGTGVASGKQEAIFMPFEQEDSSTTRKLGGTGLGLAICARLVDLMEGKIRIESPWLDPATRRMMPGSAFHFTARFLRGKAPVQSPASVQPMFRRMRILVAEDNGVNRTLAQRLLERRGHRVLLAKNGLEALDILGAERVDAVLIDIQMPEMDGFQATTAIREREQREGGHLPIVALTPHAMRGYRERCLAHGMDAYLAKPIRPDDLDRVLGEVTGGTTPPLPAQPSLAS